MAAVKVSGAGSMGSSSSSMKTISSSGDGRLVSLGLTGDFGDSCEGDEMNDSFEKSVIKLTERQKFSRDCKNVLS